jgi:UDP-N-acetylmuramoylalanine--D-glutamate ligase
MNIDDFKKICIVGWAKTGISLCNLLLALNKEVRVSESKEAGSFDQAQVDRFLDKGVSFEFGGHSLNFIKGSQLLILSPGVDTVKSEVIKIAKDAGVPCVGEIEFCFWLTQAKFIAITGTNGKTTTTHLTYQVLKEKRKRVFLGGNIGIPLSSFILDTKGGDLIVLEVSSFQLETILKFKPYVGVLLNIEPDHLDRYRNLEEYFAAKMNLFRNQGNQDWAIINKNFNFRSYLKDKIKSKIVYFSDEFDNENLSCVYRTASIFGLSRTDCLNVFSAFKGLPHRLQLVKKINGVTFINDSKATNPSSTIWALKNTKTPLILLAGGKDKGLDYSSVLPYTKRVKKINFFGEAARKIKDSLNCDIASEVFPSLKDATLASFKEAKPGDTVLLSPMCASFDEFCNYQERGEKFSEIVNNF